MARALTQPWRAQFTQPRLSDDAGHEAARAAAGAAEALPAAPRRDVLQCQAHGCTAALGSLRAYNQRVRCGEQHAAP
jgi:hypothetical protein